MKIKSQVPWWFLIACALFFGPFDNSALAHTIFVNAGAPPGGNGSAEAPYRRITDAVVEARTIRRASAAEIIIYVAAGTYVGSFDAAALASHPDQEVLPIILNVGNLTLRGETAFTQDYLGLPTGTVPGTETVLTSDMPLSLGQTLLLIAPTVDGMKPDGVTVSGFVLDPRDSSGSVRGRAILVERTLDFTIRQNLIQRAFTGITTRLASGVIQGNLFVNNVANGIGPGGGNRTWPASVVIRGNRAIMNLEGLILGAVPNLFPLQLGQNGVSVAPLQTSFNRDDPQDLENIPDRLEATVSENDLSSNRSGGLRCFYLNPQVYITANAAQPVTGAIIATVRNNRLEGNGEYGIEVDAGFPTRSIPRELIATFDGTFSGNILANNKRATAFFGFTRLQVSLGSAPRTQFKYLQDSRFTVVDLDGEFISTFDFDNPGADPFDGTMLRNRLTINGAAISGTLIH